jgi:PAS domain S-box-containing protein
MDFLRQLFSSGDFTLHGYFIIWNPGLVWLNVIADALIALAYFAILAALVWFVRKYRKLPFSWVLVLFGAFILARGTMHVMEVWNLWHAHYWLVGVINAITAAAALVAAFLLIRLMPQALDLPSTKQWIQANAALEKEVHERRELELDLRISEARYRENAELLHLTHDAIFVKNLKNEIVFWNRAAERLYGWRMEEARGKLSHDLLQTVFPKPVAEIEAELFEKGYWEGELVHRRRDGSTVIVSSRWALRTDPGGKPTAILESNRDITQRHKAQEKFRNLLESAPDAIVIVNRAGLIQLVNAQTEKLFGYAREELLGKPVEILVPSRFSSRHATYRSQYSESPHSRPMGEGLELHGRRKDGTEFPVEISLSPLETEEGTLISSAIRDISARKRAESMFRDLLESAPDAMVIVNQEGCIVLANGQAEKLFGYPRAEMLGQPVELLIPQRFRGQHAAERSAYTASPRHRAMESGLNLSCRRKDGTEFPAEIGLSPIETSEGRMISSAIRDVTDRRVAEQTLRESEERLKLTLESGRVGVWELDIAADTSVRSLRHDEIFGYSSPIPEWGVKRFMTHVLPEDLESVKASLEEAYSTDNFSMECRIRWADQSVHWISAQGRVYRDDQGKPARMRGVITDVTERKQAEEALERQRIELARSVAELAAVNKELESFSYSVSHDLRAPLRHIGGFAQILKDDHGPGLSDEIMRLVDRILHSTNHMGHLVDDLLNLARIGRQGLTLRKANLEDVVRQSMGELPAEAETRNIEWRIEPLPEMVCDKGLLKLVFTNLLSNAVKFTRNRELAVIEVGVAKSDGTTTIFVRDNGAGFDPKYADKLFGAFQRLHRQEDFEGTGVGLAIVQRIINRHGGKIWAESQPDCGTTFYFTLSPHVGSAVPIQSREVING